ncbi:MAG TPA: hypothetical protein PLB38_03035 [bacterium]|nr:hypothetical protein [bacterium]
MSGKLTAIQKSEKLKKRLQQQLEKLVAQEKTVVARWKKAYQYFLKVTGQLEKKRHSNSKKIERMWATVVAWPAESGRLTRQRDNLRAQIDVVRQQLTACDLQLLQLENTIAQLHQKNDAIVDRVFALNDEVVTSARARDAYLMTQVFTSLRKPDGTLRRQVTFVSSNQLRKVVAMVNSISYLEESLAERAEEEIKQFFYRYQVPLVADPLMAKVTELLEKVLISKRTFQVGPSLYEFLTMDLDDNLFPELVRAQQYLKAGFRSEKTNSYIRIYSRPTVTDKWQPVPQS